MSLLQGIVDKKHILLLSIPRTGSTWMGRILSSTMDYSYVHEPDNEQISFYGYYGKQGLPRFPLITIDQENKRFFELFQTAFYQGYITYDSASNQLLKKWAKISPERVEEDLRTHQINLPRQLRLPYIIGFMLPKQLGNRNNRVVKTVHALLAAEFLFTHFPKVQPLFMVRHPAAVVASLLRHLNPDLDRRIYTQPIIQTKYVPLQSIDYTKQSVEYLAGLQVAIFYHEIAGLIQKYPQAQLVRFEDLVNDPFVTSHQLFEQFDMKWKDEVELFIANSNRKGSARETRKESKRQATKWQTELTDQQKREIKKGYFLLGDPPFYQQF